MAIHGVVQAHAVGTSAVEVLGTDSQRQSVLFSVPLSSFEITISTQRDVTAGAGLVLRPDSGPILVDRARFGDAVTRPWFAVADNTGATLGLLVATGNS